MGGTWGRGLPILMAGKDFGDTILGAEPKRPKPGWSRRHSRGYHSNFRPGGWRGGRKS